MEVDNPENNAVVHDSLLLYASGPHPCPYLEDRAARDEFAPVTRLDGGTYQALMDAGFRRSGRLVYRPDCAGCRECVPIRLRVDRFTPSRSQRRVLRRNSDVQIETGIPRCTEEKWRVYQNYLRYQHDGTMDEGIDAFEEFLYRSPTETIEITYHLGGRIVAVGILDVCPDCLSTVYFYFDPAHARRSLGIFGGLCEIEECRRRGLAYWYVGFYVRRCRRMNYKASFRPHELLGPDGVWRPPADAG